MGRPREHDEQTRAALRAAAERLVAEGGRQRSPSGPWQTRPGPRPARSTASSDRRRVSSSTRSRRRPSSFSSPRSGSSSRRTIRSPTSSTSAPSPSAGSCWSTRRSTASPSSASCPAWTAARSSFPPARGRGSSFSRRWNDSRRRPPRRQDGARSGRRVQRDARGARQRRVARRRPAAPAGGQRGTCLAERADHARPRLRGGVASESPSKGGLPQARSVARNDEGPARAGPSVVPPARGLVTSSRPCRPCRACRRRPMPSRAPRRRSPRS